MDSVLPEYVAKILTPHMVLQMFSLSNTVTIFLNETFNNYEIFQLDKMRFLKYIKEIVYTKRIPRYRTCYFQHHKVNKDISLIHKFLPQLKRHEVSQFLNLIEHDKEFYDGFMMTIGLKDQQTKTSVTSEEKKKYKKEIDNMEKMEETKAVSLNDWEENFK